MSRINQAESNKTTDLLESLSEQLGPSSREAVPAIDQVAKKSFNSLSTDAGTECSSSSASPSTLAEEVSALRLDAASTEPEEDLVASDATSSDEDLSDVDIKEFVYFERDCKAGKHSFKRFNAACMTIPFMDQNTGKAHNIKGSTLIKIVHDVVQKFYRELMERTELPLPPANKGALSIQEPLDWFRTLGGWQGLMPSTEIQSYSGYEDPARSEVKNEYVRFSQINTYGSGPFFNRPVSKKGGICCHRLHLSNEIQTRKVFYVVQGIKLNEWGCNSDLSYESIYKVIEKIKSIGVLSLNDATIAELQLYALNRKDRPEWSTNEHLEVLPFLDYLNSLMFGFEASGLNTGLVTGLMTLDLIANKGATYEQAFHKNPSGGFYPFASCQTDNSGSYSNRCRIVRHDEELPSQCSMKRYRLTSSNDSGTWSPVALKEAVLIKQWLQANDIIELGTSFDQQIQKIENEIIALIERAFFS